MVNITSFSAYVENTVTNRNLEEELSIKETNYYQALNEAIALAKSGEKIPEEIIKKAICQDASTSIDSMVENMKVYLRYKTYRELFLQKVAAAI